MDNTGIKNNSNILNEIRKILFVLFFILCTLHSKGQDKITSNPDSAVIISSDIDHFWDAYDSLRGQKSTADSLKTYKDNFY